MSRQSVNRIVIWGLRRRWHTHRFIHQAFYENAKKLGYETIWIEDEEKSKKYIKTGDLIITAEPQGKMVPAKNTLADYYLPVRDDVLYCLHEYKDIFKKKLNPKNYINLEVYRNNSEQANIKFDTVRFFDTQTRTLYQPWGTNLLAGEFKKPVFRKNSLVFWVGSIWNNRRNQGNLETIAELKTVLRKKHLRFVAVRFVPEWLNLLLIRLSRIAPAIGGLHQAEVNYLPCRMFKNISYGQLGLTNIRKFKAILGGGFIEGETIEAVVENALKLSPEEYKKITAQQQEAIKKYTYKEAIENIIKAFDY